MRNLFLLTIISIFLLTGCEKKEDPVTSKTNEGVTFTTASIKPGPVYFSFDANDTVSSTAQWDIKFTLLTAPDDLLKEHPIYPGVVVNNSLNVLAAITDNVDFTSFNAGSAKNFRNDIFDTLAVDSTEGIKVTPVYYSFDLRETTSSDGKWDIKMTINESQEPLIILNSAKGVTGKVIDGQSFASVQAATITGLNADVNDTTLVIGNKCFQYNPDTHGLTPYPNRTFVVKTQNGAQVKFRLLDYYRLVGTTRTSGFMKFEFAASERYAIGTSFFFYNENDHSLTPFTKRVFSIKTHSGKFVKLQPLTYYKISGNIKESGYVKFQYTVQ